MPTLGYVYHTDFDPTSAHGNQIIHTCNALTSKGYDVTLIAAGDPDQYARSNNLEIDFRIERTGATGRNTPRDRLRYYASALFRSRSHDVLFTRDISFLRVLRRVPRRFYTPTVYEAHKAYSEIGSVTADDERSRLDAADSIITISPGIRTDLGKLDVRVDAVVPDAASTALLPESPPEGLKSQLGFSATTDLFVYSGSLSTWKNELELVISAFGAYVKGDVGLVVVGGPDNDIEPLRTVAREHGVADEVRFVGRVPQEEVFEYLAAADVGIVPLKDTDRIASHYTSPLKLYEYLISGLEVVASDVPAIVDTTTDDERVHLYHSGNGKEFGETCKAALEKARNHQPCPDTYSYSYQRRADQLHHVLVELI